MDKQKIIELLKENYKSFTNYLNDLKETDFNYRFEDKWTAGQQLDHIILCVNPLILVFSMDKSMIEQNFGTSNKRHRNYDTLQSDYLVRIKKGGKAPGQYLPVKISFTQKDILCEKLLNMITVLCSKINDFKEEDLDALCIPHPLLGLLTMREMLYNVIYHVEHHQRQAKRNLEYN